jgi:ATP-dependent 26S proteasome regulatory subunit
VFQDENGGVTKSTPTPILFIIEDADHCLVPRDDGNISTISSLLNYTDGIFGSMLDLRIIATTNAEHMDFDKALLRPGRLCRHVVVEPLSPEKAQQVYKRLTDGKEVTYTSKKTLAQVYADARGGFESAEIDKKVLGF